MFSVSILGDNPNRYRESFLILSIMETQTKESMHKELQELDANDYA